MGVSRSAVFHLRPLKIFGPVWSRSYRKWWRLGEAVIQGVPGHFSRSVSHLEPVFTPSFVSPSLKFFLMSEFQRPTFPLSPLAHKDSSDLVQCLLCQTIVSFEWFLILIRLWYFASLLGHSWLDLSISGSLSLYGSSQVVELDTSSYLHQTLQSFGLMTCTGRS